MSFFKAWIYVYSNERRRRQLFNNPPPFPGLQFFFLSPYELFGDEGSEEVGIWLGEAEGFVVIDRGGERRLLDSWPK